jgi:ADP-heptose:LPS heptosyltransferase
MSSDRQGRGARIAVLRALPGLGDLLCAVPALRAVRAAHPSAHVTLLGLPSARWFVDRFSNLVDELVPVDAVPGLVEVTPDPPRALAFLHEVQARRFDLALQLHGSGVTTNPLLTLMGARHQVSAHRPGDWVPPGTSVELPDDRDGPDERPEIDRLLSVTTAAGCPPVGRDIDLPVGEAEAAGADELLAEVGLAGRPFACIHPGASRPERRWPAGHFVASADHLAGRGLPVALTGSPGEQTLVGAVQRATRAGTAVDLSGRTDVGVLGALYRRARLVVSSDTGAAHVAAAVRAPSVVVFGPGPPGRWAPLDAERHRRVLRPPSADWPAPSAVAAAIDAQLTRFGDHP